jgi:DNA-binding response OmpR family regulator
MRKALIIDDDAALAATLQAALETEGFKVRHEADGEAGWARIQSEKFDLVVLDLVLPGLGGLEVCRKMREGGNQTPVVLISGKKMEEVDKVVGLELGADEYLLKPFGTHEFVARVHAVLRRARPEAPELEECSFGDCYVNFAKKIATKGGRDLALTAKEFGLLQILAAHEGEVVTRDMILNKVWGYEKFPTTRTVDTFIYGLRRKVEDDPASPRHILTVPWSGYRFEK